MNALLSDADTRVLQNPSMRATDGQQATLKIGSRIPIATGSYSAGAATGITAGIGVQTQFSYIDVGVNIDMTPTIHLDREVTLKLDVENSTQSGSVTISGVTEPIIGTRSDKTHHPATRWRAVPAGRHPHQTGQHYQQRHARPLRAFRLLKYFFGSVYKENDQDEVVFILIPHIVRESVLTRLNTRAIDTGTVGQYRAAPRPQRRRRAPVRQLRAGHPRCGLDHQRRQRRHRHGAADEAAGHAAHASRRRHTGGGTARGRRQARPSSSPCFRPSPRRPLAAPSAPASRLAGAHDVYSVPLQIQFDPKVLQLVNVDAGGLLGGDGQPVALVHRDEGNGLVTISASRPPGVAGVDGQGEVCILTFKAHRRGRLQHHPGQGRRQEQLHA